MDIPARVWGEEFAILFPETTMEQVKKVCERILNLLRKSLLKIQDTDSEIKYSCSIGPTALTADDNYQTLYKKADNLLYTAKKAGRDRIISDAVSSGNFLSD